MDNVHHSAPRFVGKETYYVRPLFEVLVGEGFTTWCRARDPHISYLF